MMMLPFPGVESNGPSNPEELKKWTNAAGPRQSKKALEAIAELLFLRKSFVEITGVVGKPDTERRTVLTALTGLDGKDNEYPVTLYNEIGDRFGWYITRDNYNHVYEAFVEAKKQASECLPEVDKRRSQADDKAILDERKKRDEAFAKREVVIKASHEAILAKKPEWAEALIVALLDKDECDSMTDYFHHTESRAVAIGWRRGKREDFRQLRRAAATFAETAHLGPGQDKFIVKQLNTAIQVYSSREGREFASEAEAKAWMESPEAFEELGPDGKWVLSKREVEHREKYSGGSGNYLKDGYNHDSGWRVCSCSLKYSLPSCIIEDHLPADNMEAKNGESPKANGIDKIWIESKNRHAFVVRLADRVSKDRFKELAAAARAIGGGYSRWSQGFSFRTEEMAKEFRDKYCK